MEQRLSPAEIKTRLADLASLAEHMGWQDFVEAMNMELEVQRGKLERAVDLVEVHRKQGAISILREILSYAEKEKSFLEDALADVRNSSPSRGTNNKE